MLTGNNTYIILRFFLFSYFLSCKNSQIWRLHTLEKRATCSKMKNKRLITSVHHFCRKLVFCVTSHESNLYLPETFNVQICIKNDYSK